MITALALGFVGLVLWAMSLVLLVGAVRGGQGGVRVLGKITGSRDFLEHGRTMFVAEFCATTPDGRTVHGTGTKAQSWRPRVGEPIALLYRAHDRARPLVEAGPIRFLASALVAFVALVLTAIAVVVALDVA